MSNDVYAGTVKYNLIYIFEILDDAHKGYLKVGEHRFESASSYKQLPPNCDELNKQAKIRMDQYTKTAFIQCNLLYTELARRQVRLADGTVENSLFSDGDVHEVLDRSGYDARRFWDSDYPSEWYKVDLPTAIAAIKAVKDGRNTLTAEEMPVKEALIKPREEQSRCVAKTKTVFSRSDRMLWDCKMRFGKTVTAYMLVKEMNFQKVLVVTHRPAVVDGWQTDFYKIFDDDRVFVTKANIKVGDRFTDADASIDAENDRNLQNLAQSGKPFVYFASMQDLRGSELVNGKYPKNKAVFAMDWDLIIYDEAHEGTQTELGKSVQELLEQPKEGKKPKKVLQLSGTPYNLLNQYSEDNVFQWDYVMEQQAKLRWENEHPGDHNPYADLPELRICTFDLRNKLAGSYRYEDENIAFNFREFFRTWTGDPKRDFRVMPSGVNVGDFVHAGDVRAFLDLISAESADSNYPFSTQEYRDMFRHTFWILPGVKEARAFSAMLKKHPVFHDYEVVNVAGEGDVEKPYDDALAEVREAIKNHDRTITLSCGKLTTGVTVKEWTGVMLLSGSSSTGAAGYMQTIFRVQSAGTIDGKMKSVCYAFDFAPDRALKVLAEVHKLKKSAVGTDDTGRVQLGEFLNFCPVLAEAETGMEPYDVPKMMRQLKKITVDAAIKSGFDDDSIYKADAGIVMDKDKVKLFDILKKRLTPQKQSKNQTKVDVNRQGLSQEEYKKAQDAKRKPKRERTPEEQAALDKEKEMKKQQQGLFDLLRNVSIRLPLLIFGTATEFDESIRLAEFVDKVDAASWQEFMPKEVDKDLFLKLLVFYDEDVIEGAGMRIRRMAKAADELMPTQRVMKIAEIFTYFKNPAKETVLTPWRVVNMHMGDTIGGYNFYKEGYPVQDGLLDEPRLIEQGEVTSNLFLNDKVQILEMNSKSGLYPLYVAYSIYRMMLPKDEERMTLEEAQTWWQRALRDHLFVLCQTTMAVAITKRTLAGYTGAEVNAIYLTKLFDRMEDKQRLARKLTNPDTWKKEGERLKFDAVVGNPPYQLMDGGGKGYSAKPIYNLFVDVGKTLNPHYLSMITPSRWFTGGKGLDEFRLTMLKDKHIKKIVDYVDNEALFKNVAIVGGVNYFLWDNTYSGPCEIVSVRGDDRFVQTRELDEYDIFIRNNNSVQLIHRVEQSGEQTMDKFVYPRNVFGIPSDLRGKEEKDLLHNIALFSSQKSNSMTVTYISKEDVTKEHDLIGKYKVIMGKVVPRGGEVGVDPSVGYRVTSTIQVLCPDSVFTDSYLLLAVFSSLDEAENFAKYMCLKFPRFLLHETYSSMNISKQNFRFVPYLDYTRAWTDGELYSRYNCSVEEIQMIEKMIRPMEYVVHCGGE